MGYHHIYLGVPEGEEKEKVGEKKYVKRQMAENVVYLMTSINLQIQEVQ